MEDTRKFQKEFGEASLRVGLPAVVTNVRPFPEGIEDRRSLEYPVSFQ